MVFWQSRIILLLLLTLSGLNLIRSDRGTDVDRFNARFDNRFLRRIDDNFRKDIDTIRQLQRSGISICFGFGFE